MPRLSRSRATNAVPRRCPKSGAAGSKPCASPQADRVSASASAHRGPHRVRHRGEFQIVPERVARVGINELQATGTVAAIDDRQLLTFDFGERRIPVGAAHADVMRSEEHTSELQSLIRISYDVFCLNKKT